jgi:hypothetical protein
MAFKAPSLVDVTKHCWADLSLQLVLLLLTQNASLHLVGSRLPAVVSKCSLPWTTCFVYPNCRNNCTLFTGRHTHFLITLCCLPCHFFKFAWWTLLGLPRSGLLGLLCAVFLLVCMFGVPCQQPMEALLLRSLVVSFKFTVGR